MKPKIGDLVTCKIAVQAYYTTNVWFKPGMIGTVKAITPKVRIVYGDEYDRAADFAVVDFQCEETGKTERTSLNFCNVVKIKKEGSISVH